MAAVRLCGGVLPAPASCLSITQRVTSLKSCLARRDSAAILSTLQLGSAMENARQSSHRQWNAAGEKDEARHFEG